jgi:hypothetical protein
MTSNQTEASTFQHQQHTCMYQTDSLTLSFLLGEPHTQIPHTSASEQAQGAVEEGRNTRHAPQTKRCTLTPCRNSCSATTICLVKHNTSSWQHMQGCRVANP